MDFAQRHRRYGVGMIHLKLRQAGEIVNYKRVERLYGIEKLHIRRRQRKKVPVWERQPLVRPGQAKLDVVGGPRVQPARFRENAEVPGDRR